MALAAGMSLNEFYHATIGEVVAVLKAADRRRKDEQTIMVDSLLRAIGCAFGSTSDPFDGLNDETSPVEISAAEAKLLRFWRPPDGNRKARP